MLQKVLEGGSRMVVTIPEKSLGEIGLKIGDHVKVEVDRKNKALIIRGAPRLKKK